MAPVKFQTFPLAQACLSDRHWWIRWVTLIHLIGLCRELSTMPTLRCQDPRTELYLLWTSRQCNFLVVCRFMRISMVLTGRGMEGNLQDMEDLGGSEAPLARLA